jgi:surface polysaccharide O-acyltransferase-like enzyme
MFNIDSNNVNVNKRIIWLDYIRVFAITLVVLLHVSANFVYHVENSVIWWIADTLNSLARPGVPLFLMVSGLLLLNSKDSISIFYYKRMKKILLPYLFWSIIYIFLYKYSNNEIITLSSAIKKIFTFSASFHLGFFNYLLALYLVVPFLANVLTKIDNARIKYFLILWFIFIPLSMTLTKLFNFHISIGPELFTSFIGLFVLGFYLGGSEKFNLSLAFILYLMSLVFTIVMTFTLSIKNKQLDEFFYQYQTPNVVFMSLFIFLFFKDKLKDRIANCHKMNKMIFLLSDLSFGVYLVHIIVLTLVTKLNLSLILGKCSFIILLIIPLETLMILIVSYLMVYCIKKIPYLKAIV